MTDFNAIWTIAYRDLLKFLRDRPRIIASFIFPFIFIAILGSSFQASVGSAMGYNFVLYTFTGVYAQTLFQSAAFGIISLIEDRDNDFSQEIFVSPISRYSIVFGKIVGESLVAMAQGIGILVFGIIVAATAGVSISVGQMASLVPVGFAVCLFGGAFGIIVLANIHSRRAAEQVFPFIMLPQYFLAGVFNPINNMPLVVNFLSLISPLRYAVDLTRGIFYTGTRDFNPAVLSAPWVNIAVILAMFAGFLVLGTIIFVRVERNR
jgi:ABC-2 type transport system permease protein